MMYIQNLHNIDDLTILRLVQGIESSPEHPELPLDDLGHPGLSQDTSQCFLMQALYVGDSVFQSLHSQNRSDLENLVLFPPSAV